MKEKELSIEEKARRYDEALEKSKKLYEQGTITESLCYVFPELKESEDERVRKGIIRNLEYLMDRAEGFVKDELKERIAWLEKQGKQIDLVNKESWRGYREGKQEILDKYSELEKQGEKGINGNEREIPNSAWSEEDEKIYSRIYYLIHNAAFENYEVDEDGKELGEYAKIVEWFKLLKDRVQPQPKQEWGEEDERKINRIYTILVQAADTHAFSISCRLIGDKECIELQDFLK